MLLPEILGSSRIRVLYFFEWNRILTTVNLAKKKLLVKGSRLVAARILRNLFIKASCELHYNKKMTGLTF